MSYGFWETLQGHQLADVLIETLPKLTKPRKQGIEIIPRGTLKFALNHMIKNEKKTIIQITPLNDQFSKFLVLYSD